MPTRSRLALFILFGLTAARVCLPGAHAAAQPDANRLKNPGAEEALKSDPSLPAAWTAAATHVEGLSMRRDDAVARAGGASLFVGNTHNYPQETFNNWAQRVPGLSPGESFTLSGWVMTEAADGASMCVQVWDEGGKSVIAFVATPTVIGTRGWQFIRTEPIRIPVSARMVVVRAGLRGKGKAWFDELRLSLGDGARLPEPPAQPGANLVSNPGAETPDPRDPGEPAIWFKAQVAAPGLVMSRHAEAARSGKASLYIANAHDYPDRVSNNWSQAIGFDLAGRTVRLSAWVRTEDAEHVTLCVQGFNDLASMVSFGGTEALKGTTAWTLVETKPVRLARTVTTTTVRALLTGRGKVWFDDITLEIVGDEIPAE